MTKASAAEAPPRAAAPEAAPPPSGSRHGYGVPGSPSEESEAIRRYAPLVKRLALHLLGRLPETVQLDDLVQAGMIALLRILRRGAAAVSEAARRRAIVNAMIDEARREAWAPVRTVRLAKAAAAAMRAVKRRTGRDASDEEIATEMQIPLPDYHRILVEIAGIRLFPLDGFAEGAEPSLQIADSQESGLHRSRVMAALAAAITELPQREKLVVSLYYDDELNMAEIGRVLGLDKSTVCRAHGRALLILRNALGDSEPDLTLPWPSAGD